MAARVRVEPAEITIRRLESYVQSMEIRYECPSTFAEEAVRRGRMTETAEVSRWLTSYRTLLRLRNEFALVRSLGETDSQK